MNVALCLHRARRPRYWSISFPSSVISACIRIIVIEYWERGHWAVLSLCFLAHHFSTVISRPTFLIIIQLVKISIELLHFSPIWHLNSSRSLTMCFSVVSGCYAFAQNMYLFCMKLSLLNG
jgi:hypothetical protein